MSDNTPIAGDYNNLTAPIVKVWKGLLGRAREAKKLFAARGDQVMSFYSGGPDAMWGPAYMNRFMGGPTAVAPPKFKITLNIAFEQVAIMGPLLFWEMADIKVSPHKAANIDPNMLAGGDPRMAQMFDALAQQQAQSDAKNEMRAQLLGPILNYFQREQPSGLSAHSALAVFEMLTKGAGFLRTEEYRFPFSPNTFVGSFFTSVDDVLVDADCTDPLWNTANFVAIRHRSKVDEVEEHFGLRPGSLNQYAVLSSPGAGYQASAEPNSNTPVPKDLIEWYEIFSRGGFGNRLVSRQGVPPIAPEFDAARGAALVNGKLIKDTFAYLCVCPQCPYPLNLTPQDLLRQYATPEESNAAIKAKTDWPTEYWRDNKWPIEMLAVYPHSGTSPWPEPPLAPALGELTCLNILMSAYIEQAWNSRQTVIATQKGAIQNLQNLLAADTSTLHLEVDPNVNPGSMANTIKDLLQFMNRPEVNGDLIQSIEFVIGLIEKRTGLSPILYGQTQGAEPRSATAYQGRADTVNIRPDYMRKKVAEWESAVADKAVYCAYTHVDSASIAPQLGPLGVVAWDMLITEASPEEILRSADVVVEASDIRRPNKSKDSADMKELQQYYLPILAGQLAQTGDVGPINGFIRAYGDAAEIDVTPMLLPEGQPNPVDEEMKVATLDKIKAEIEKLHADATKSMADAEAAGVAGEAIAHGAEVKAQSAEHAAMVKQQTAEHAMSLKEQQAELDAARKQQEMMNAQGTHEQTQAERMAEARQKLGIDLLNAQQGLHQSAATHMQQTAIADQKTADDARRANLITYSKILNMRAEQQARSQTMQGRPE